jgi:hypothetical protein
MLERQREGIARAKAAGKYKGRPVSIDPTPEFLTERTKEGLCAQQAVDRTPSDAETLRDRRRSPFGPQLPDLRRVVRLKIGSVPWRSVPKRKTADLEHLRSAGFRKSFHFPALMLRTVLSSRSARAGLTAGRSRGCEPGPFFGPP